MTPRWRVRWWQAAAAVGVLLVILTAVSHATRGGHTSSGTSPVANATSTTHAAPPAPSTHASGRKTAKGGTAAHSTRKQHHHTGLTVSDRTPGHGIVLPDRTATPGAINGNVTQADIHATICVAGYTATIRPASSYTTALKIAQLGNGYTFRGDTNTGDYEEDHLISLELGGSPTRRANLWPEPYDAQRGARVKDVVENKLHELVCAGAISLRTAQRAIAKNWWKAYQRYVATSAAPTHHVPPAPPITTHRVPPPPAQHSCTTTSSGSCIRGGEFCPEADYGQTGYDADGTAYTCTGDATHPRWE